MAHFLPPELVIKLEWPKKIFEDPVKQFLETLSMKRLKGIQSCMLIVLIITGTYKYHRSRQHFLEQVNDYYHHDYYFLFQI